MDQRPTDPTIAKTASDDGTPVKSSHAGITPARLGFLAIVVLSTWCGMLSGLLEVSTLIIRKHVYELTQLYGMTHHFAWLIPVADVVILVAVGLVGAVACWAWPGRGQWLLGRALCALVLLPALLVAFPRFYGVPLFLVAIGAAAHIVPILERRPRFFRRLVVLGFPLLFAAIAITPASDWAAELDKQSQEDTRPLPPAGTPSVLLVVMDTVAAGHMGLNGYHRPTSTTLVELAERGIRFDSAVAASSWTLPSHATMFTGKWLHDLDVGWLTPMGATNPTVAEFLGARGFATAGFVANYTYCARDSGLARGFTHYADYIFPELTCFKPAALVSRTLASFQAIVDDVESALGSDALRPYLKRLLRLLDNDRKGAAVVNAEFVDWLTRRTRPDRPFFAFLNYFDAHSPYQLGAGRMHRFGAFAVDNRRRDLLQNWFESDKSKLSPEEIEFVIDAYDECIADLDEQLGVLFDELGRRGILETTWLIVVADHGESFGEHAGVFNHGTSLYQTEIHVPLLIVPPGGKAGKTVVKETVSLRDLAATFVDVAGMTAGSPFPGNSLARFGGSTASGKPGKVGSEGLAEVVPYDPLGRDQSDPAKKSWPLGALVDGEWSFIRREGNVREELFHLTDDRNQKRDLTGDPAHRPRLEQMRSKLQSLTAGEKLGAPLATLRRPANFADAAGLGAEAEKLWFDVLEEIPADREAQAKLQQLRARLSLIGRP